MARGLVLLLAFVMAIVVARSIVAGGQFLLLLILALPILTLAVGSQYGIFGGFVATITVLCVAFALRWILLAQYLAIVPLALILVLLMASRLSYNVIQVMRHGPVVDRPEIGPEAAQLATANPESEAAPGAQPDAATMATPGDKERPAAVGPEGQSQPTAKESESS